MRTFAFLTLKNDRVDVEASSARAGFNKLNSIPHIRNMGIVHDTMEMDLEKHEVAGKGQVAQYLDYDKDGSIYGWEFLHI